MTCRNSVSLGAYLLGALDPAERASFQEHLNVCPRCQAELVRLSPLPGLLQRLTPEEFDALDAEPAGAGPVVPQSSPDVPEVDTGSRSPAPVLPLPVVAGEPAASDEPDRAGGPRRRRLRWLTAAAASVVLVCALGMGAALLFRQSEPEGPVTWSAVDSTTGVRANVQLTERSWGTEVKLSMRGVPAGNKLCHMVVYGRDGTEEIAGKWTSGYYSSVTEIPGSTSVELTDIDRIEVIAGNGVLVGVRSP